MDNQHRKITGYRELTEQEIALMNDIKSLGEPFERLFKVMEKSPQFDQRWVAIGKTNLQQGIMALVRAVTKPESF